MVTDGESIFRPSLRNEFTFVLRCGSSLLKLAPLINMATNGMDTMGSQLEKAREKKGVTVREAAEATKIRMEYLLQFESDDFEIPLPPIYQRGFIKIYARYLNEDPDKYIGEIQARLNRKQAIQTKHDVRASLGHMDVATRRPGQASPTSVPEATGSASVIDDGPSEEKKRWKVPQIKVPNLRSNPSDSEPEYDDFEESGEPLDRTFYMKVAAIVGSVTIAVVLLFAVIKLIFSGGSEDSPKPEINPDLASSGAPAQIVDNSPPAQSVSNDLIIRATGGPTWVQIKSDTNDEVIDLFSLSPGESRTVTATGNPWIQFTMGENLEVVRNGETFAPSKSGAGKIQIK